MGDYTNLTERADQVRYGQVGCLYYEMRYSMITNRWRAVMLTRPLDDDTCRPLGVVYGSTITDTEARVKIELERQIRKGNIT